ncbi:CIS tube protein [Hwangdonia lutea]|uniref:LysM peptidoglycan-binding domain-containing protein n=1 Tax=Hwangdonia lutea TaxID=3075823 RepID=A0AA97EMJ0_9FLAO|nr:LysM peptidoglycan-binding domain-containing protein [Hwangdonia sp. SCSIO 19198]WOD42835.1 LysM peptidoglycan-binding domain-containing protein [Hwangdonia sp. SCSIO 19198]
MFSTGELTKLKIIAYSDDTFENEVSDGEFTTLINPEKYAFNYKIEQNEEQAQGTSATAPGFNKILPEHLDINFVFDRTGAIRTSEVSDDGVIKDVDKFKKVVFDYNGDQHKPNYLKISWGTLLFKGTLLEMTVDYKLFNPNGTPIRAMANAKFQRFVSDELRVAEENSQSPDLTHLRTVKNGDTLPLMSYRIYGDSKYYLEVAKANGITNFRQLAIGQQLVFPPLEKTS